MKRLYFNILLGFYVLAFSLFAQEEKIKIVGLLDCNLFETETGCLVRLANIKTPSISDTNTISKKVSAQIISWLKKKILDKHVTIQFSDSISESSSEPIPIQIF